MSFAGNSVLDKTVVVLAAAAASTVVKCDASECTNSNLAVETNAAATVPSLGVLIDETLAANQVSRVRTSGIAYVIANGNSTNIAAGDMLIPTTSGKVIKIAASSATVQWSIGQALAPCTADGVLIPVLLNSVLVVKGTA